MSIQDDNQHNKSSAPESLGQVLNSLQNILEHKHFPFAHDTDEPSSTPEQATESLSKTFDDSETELLALDTDIPVLQTSEITSDEIDIPVLDDIVFKGLSEHPENNREIESQLEQLRNELDNIVGDIMDEARQQFESGESVSTTENNMQRFLRELSHKTAD